MGEESRGRDAAKAAKDVMSWVGSAVVAVPVTAACGWLTDWFSDWSVMAVVVSAVVGVTVAAGFALTMRRGPLAGAAAVVVGLLACGTVVWAHDDPTPADTTDACGRTSWDWAPEVVVVWEGEELSDFCAVVAAYGSDVRVTSVGEGISRALIDRVESGDPPDVALIPQPSLVQRLVVTGRLCPMEPQVAERMPDEWRALVTGGEAGNAPEYPYGTFVKGVDKSLFWYRTGTIEDQEPEGWAWDDLTEWVAAALDDGSGIPPLEVPAANQWTLTDWFENQLADRAPDLYRRLASGTDPDWGPGPDRDALVGVLDAMADVWAEPGVFPEGAAAPADTSWRDVGRRLYDSHAQLAFGPSVVAGTFGDLPGNVSLRPIAFPGRVAGQGPSIVGGDIAVVLKQDGECRETILGRTLVDWLTDVEAMEAWIARDPGYLTPNLRSPLIPGSDPPPAPADRVRSLLTSRLQHPPGGELFFDLSDDRFAVKNDGDTTVTWDILGDYFDNVTTGAVPRACAIDQTITRLSAAYRGDPPAIPPCDT